MKNKKLLALGICGATLWAAVLTTYAAQMKKDLDDGRAPRVLEGCVCSCSSSSSSGEPE